MLHFYLQLYMVRLTVVLISQSKCVIQFLLGQIQGQIPGQIPGHIPRQIIPRQVITREGLEEEEQRVFFIDRTAGNLILIWFK